MSKTHLAVPFSPMNLAEEIDKNKYFGIDYLDGEYSYLYYHDADGFDENPIPICSAQQVKMKKLPNGQTVVDENFKPIATQKFYSFGTLIVKPSTSYFCDNEGYCVDFPTEGLEVYNNGIVYIKDEQKYLYIISLKNNKEKKDRHKVIASIKNVDKGTVFYISNARDFEIGDGFDIIEPTMFDDTCNL